MKTLTFNQVKKLRNQIVLNSLFFKDYINTYTSALKASNYFDCYCNYLADLAIAETGTDTNFLAYDNEQNLLDFYLIYGGDIC